MGRHGSIRNGLKKIIQEKDWETLRDRMGRWNLPDVLPYLKKLRNDELFSVFINLPEKTAIKLLVRLNPRRVVQLMARLGAGRRAKILLEMAPDDRAKLLGSLPDEQADKLLLQLPEEERKETEDLLGHPEDSVGRLMTPDFVTLRKDWTVRKAIRHVRAEAKDAETINTLYVVDREGHILDDLRIRKLILARPDTKVESLMDGEYLAVLASDDREKAVRLAKEHKHLSLPVLSERGAIVGIVTLDDLLRVDEEEVTEDIHKSSAVLPLDMGYMHSSPMELYKRRILWLLFLTFAGFIASLIIAQFEQALVVAVALAFFIPILIGSGGNSGVQSASLTLRALATGDLTLDDWLGVLKKEVAVGILLGLSLALVLYALCVFVLDSPEIGIVLAVSIAALILWANVFGGLLPIALTHAKLDPAVVSSPLITTLIDIFGVFIYFSIAVWLLGI